jgi:hypothetical protein
MPKTKKNRLKLPARPCDECGGTFTPVRKAQRFHGAPKTCRRDFHNARIKRALAEVG